MKFAIRTCLFTGSLCSIFMAVASGAPDQPLYFKKDAPLEKRVGDLMGRLTQDEKLSLLAGATSCTTAAIPRLQIPSLRMADAGAGVRGIDETNNGPATLFTCGVMMGSTWDPELIGRTGEAIGEEARNKKMGSQILLGPAVNIQRSPLGGRNGEYLSEDPWLAGKMAAAYIRGMQGEGTAACIKHFACNNEEVDRDSVNVEVSERALREIYLPAFEAGIKEGQVWAVMSSYNEVNGLHSSANPYLLTDVLKKGWGFEGLVMSDWGGVHEAAASLNAGNDLEMPGEPRFLTPANVRLALQKGQTSWPVIDEAVSRTVRTMIRTGLLDGPWVANAHVVNSPAHQKIARELAEQGIVLLKNMDNILPLDTEEIHSIALIGPGAKTMQIGALGSPEVQPFYSVGPQEGITKRAGTGIAVHCVAEDSPDHFLPVPDSSLTPAGNGGGQGLFGEYFNNPDLAGKPAQTRTDSMVNFNWSTNPVGLPGIGPNNFSVRWTGVLRAPETGHYLLNLTADDGCRLFLDGKEIIDHWIAGSAVPVFADVNLVAGQTYPIRIEYFQLTGDAIATLSWRPPSSDNRAEAIAAARSADVAIFFATTFNDEGEGHDRHSMSLPDDQDGFIRAVEAANKRTIVVLNNGTPVDMRSWIDQTPGILEAWFPGQEGGNALASILFGDVNPSGKLPTTFGARREDYPDYGHFPGVNNVVQYAEGIYVGYRHFDQAAIAPLFPFGFGLSYTSFAYGALQLSNATLAPTGTITVSFPLTNTGVRAGREVAELYIHDPAPKIDRPVREMKGFAKIELAPGETKIVTLPLTARDLAYFDVAGKQWKADAGDYEIEMGSSSRDLRQKATIHLPADFTQAVPLSADQLRVTTALRKSPNLKARRRLVPNRGGVPDGHATYQALW